MERHTTYTVSKIFCLAIVLIAAVFCCISYDTLLLRNTTASLVASCIGAVWCVLLLVNIRLLEINYDDIFEGDDLEMLFLVQGLIISFGSLVTVVAFGIIR